jgi:hypothetical protein
MFYCSNISLMLMTIIRIVEIIVRIVYTHSLNIINELIPWLEFFLLTLY